MYTVMRKGYAGLDDDVCADGEYDYMDTEESALSLASWLEKSYRNCSGIHPWQGSEFYVQEVNDEYLKFIGRKVKNKEGEQERND